VEYTTLRSLIPESKVEAVEKALQQAFKTKTVESIVPLAGGLSSALVYKIVVHDKPYVLRLIMEINPLSEPVRQYTCMKLAADAGVAPHVYYASTEDALSITEFIQTVPFAGNISSRDALLIELAKTIKRIHSTPLFPKLVNYLDGIDGFIQDFKASRILPESATAELFSLYSHIQQAYPRYDTDVVSSHNDLNGNNILFDGQRIWIIDWEAAFENDRYVDLANVGNFYVSDQAQEEIFLKACFGDSLDEYKRARFFLMQQVCHMFYAMIMLKFAAALKPADWAHDENMDVPRLIDFRTQLGEGKVSLASHEGQLLFGKVLLNEMLHNMKTPRFAEAIDRMNSTH
jgi:thiamine kinase-like enzyme